MTEKKIVPIDVDKKTSGSTPDPAPRGGKSAAKSPRADKGRKTGSFRCH